MSDTYLLGRRVEWSTTWGFDTPRPCGQIVVEPDIPGFYTVIIDGTAKACLVPIANWRVLPEKEAE